MKHRFPFGSLKIGPLARRKIAEALDRDWVTEGPNVRKFEEQFAAKFGWEHCIATSSGTMAGQVVWAAVRELSHCPHYGGAGNKARTGYIVTPACAFAATVNSILASGMRPIFIDVDLDTLNIHSDLVRGMIPEYQREFPFVPAIQFVATMGKPTPVAEIAKIAEEDDLYVIGDWCEAHGSLLMSDESPPKALPGMLTQTEYADHLCDVSIYSFYVAHLIVGGEGGIICTDDDELADLCRSVKSHGRLPGSNYFDFQRIGFNAKWNDLCAAVALDSLEKFDEIFARRREIRRRILDGLMPLEDKLILYRDGPGEVISPHAFPMVLRDETATIDGLYNHLEARGIECKTLFGSLPTQHAAFKFLGHQLGDFPVAERIGRAGLHFGLSEHMTDEDVGFVIQSVAKFFR